MVHCKKRGARGAKTRIEDFQRCSGNFAFVLSLQVIKLFVLKFFVKYVERLAKIIWKHSRNSQER